MITPPGRRRRVGVASSVADMDEQRGPGAGPPEQWRTGGPPRGWRQGPPGWSRRAAGRGGGREAGGRVWWPWASPGLFTALVLVGSGFAGPSPARCGGVPPTARGGGRVASLCGGGAASAAAAARGSPPRRVS